MAELRERQQTGAGGRVAADAGAEDLNRRLLLAWLLRLKADM